MKFIAILKAAIITMSFAFTSAYASLMLTSDNTIYDDESGLEWMQLTETEYLSWNEVNYLLENETGFIGWRFASLIDINELLSSYSTTSPTSAELVSSGWDFSSANFGLYAGEHMDSGSQVRMFDLSRTGTFNYFSNHSALDTKFVRTGSYLVRTATVPEPSTLAILALSLIYLVTRRLPQL